MSNIFEKILNWFKSEEELIISKSKIGKKYTWKPDVPDIRDLKYTESVVKLPTSVDVSNVNKNVYDQGQLGSCFSGETKIPLLNGEVKTIEELYNKGEEFWVFSLDENGSLVAGKAKSNLTGIDKEVIEVTLDNGSSIICTPDHKFMMRDGTFKKVREIDFSESLMPNNLKIHSSGYYQYFDNFTNKWTFIHSAINKIFNSEYKKIVESRIIDKGDRFLVTHHRNFNKMDNTPENLEWMGELEHQLYHKTAWNGTEAQRDHSRKLINKMYESNPNWNEGASSIGGKKTWELAKNDPERMEKINKWKKAGHSDESRKKANISHKKRFEDPVFMNNFKKVMKNNSDKYLSFEENRNKLSELGRQNLGTNTTKNMIIKWSRELLDEKKEINEEKWNEMKKKSELKNFYNFSTIKKFFSSIEEVNELALNYNHKIISKRTIKEKINVYCLEVEKYHNFALESGVFVHNCTANSLSGSFDYERIKQKLKPLFPSRLFIYYNERAMEGTIKSDSGAQIRDGIKTLASQGVCPESEWYYNVSKFAVKPNEQCYQNAKSNTIKQYLRLDNTNLNQLKTCLVQGYTFVFGFTVYESFESDAVASTGIVPMPDPNEQCLGGHAVYCVGYDDSKKAFKVRNSWGNEWGDGGNFWLPYDYMTNTDLASDFWTIRLI